MRAKVTGVATKSVHTDLFQYVDSRPGTISAILFGSLVVHSLDPNKISLADVRADQRSTVQIGTGHIYAI